MFLVCYNKIMKGYIYKLENKITKDVYIGQSICVEERIKNHYRNALTYGVKGKLYDSIREYGRKNFKEYILVEIERENKEELIEELFLLENTYIKKYDSLKSGLNSSYSTKIILNTPSGKKKREVNQYDLDGNFIKKWDYIKLAAIENNTSAGHIVNCCKYRCPTANGYIWQYADEIDVERVLKYISNTYLVHSKVKRFKENGVKPKHKQNLIKNFNKNDYLDKW